MIYTLIGLLALEALLLGFLCVCLVRNNLSLIAQHASERRTLLRAALATTGLEYEQMERASEVAEVYKMKLASQSPREKFRNMARDDDRDADSPTDPAIEGMG